eukprot:758472-Hanusia_phi.AAC.3
MAIGGLAMEDLSYCPRITCPRFAKLGTHCPGARVGPGPGAAAPRVIPRVLPIWATFCPDFDLATTERYPTPLGYGYFCPKGPVNPCSSTPASSVLGLLALPFLSQDELRHWPLLSGGTSTFDPLHLFLLRVVPCPGRSSSVLNNLLDFTCVLVPLSRCSYLIPEGKLFSPPPRLVFFLIVGTIFCKRFFFSQLASGTSKPQDVTDSFLPDGSIWS